MEMTLLFITVWFTQFLIVSALNFSTQPTYTPSDFIDTTQITSATTKTNPEPNTLIYATPSSPLTATTHITITNLPSEVQTQTNITPNVTPTQETASLQQLNTSSSPSQHVMMDDGESVTNVSNVTVSDDNTSHTTVSTNFATQTNDSTETGTTPSVSYNSDRSTVQTTDTSSDPVDSVSTAPWRYSTEKEDERTNADEGNYETNSTLATFTNMNEESRGTRGTEGSYTFSSEHSEAHYDTTANTINVSDTTATVSNNQSTPQNTDIPTTTPSYTTANTVNVSDTTATVSNNRSTPKNTDIPTTTPSYTTANTVNVSDTTATVSNNRSTPQNTDIPSTTPSYTTAQGYPTVTDAPEDHTSTSGDPLSLNSTHLKINSTHSTTQGDIYRFTNPTETTGRENRTEPDTPGGTPTNINVSVTTDNSLNATNYSSNTNDTENKARPPCLSPTQENHSWPSKLVCFLILWTLAMTASIFLGITIFLWVRLSVSKKKMKRRVKGGETCEKKSLWADPKASVQDRVEFWYVNGSTLEADRKDRRRRRTRGREQDTEENSLWIQPRVTVEDITEFWYANRRTKEERTEDT
ncbi:mucin-5AC [Carassius gibelio]|uniref:mucin-5AC n=1 Tax=Carassius gibelio TaxID=101364 RepID=UPI002279E3AC|nr:mucin-5AC [Carassius gibelio]